MELHCVSHDVSHLVVPAVVHSLHGMQDSSLHRFQSVPDVRHRSLKNNVGCIVKEPVLVHTAEMVYNGSVKPVDRLVI